MGKPINTVKWMGDEIGTCPVCHSNLLIVPKRNPVVCPICGIKGQIHVEGDEITVIFSKEEQKKSHLTLEGLREHRLELQGFFKKAEQVIQREGEDLSKRLQRYEGYREIKVK